MARSANSTIFSCSSVSKIPIKNAVERIATLNADCQMSRRANEKYQDTFKELDQVFKSKKHFSSRLDDNDSDIIYELKQLTERQMSEIVYLQRELDSIPPTSTQHQDDLLQAYEELEEQLRDSQEALTDSLNKASQLQSELEDRENLESELRGRLTEIAEVFEKKEIK